MPGAGPLRQLARRRIRHPWSGWSVACARHDEHGPRLTMAGPEHRRAERAHGGRRALRAGCTGYTTDGEEAEYEGGGPGWLWTSCCQSSRARRLAVHTTPSSTTPPVPAISLLYCSHCIEVANESRAVDDCWYCKRTVVFRWTADRTPLVMQNGGRLCRSRQFHEHPTPYAAPLGI